MSDLAPKRRQELDAIVAGYFTAHAPPTSDRPTAGAEATAEWVFTTVGRLMLEPHEIRHLLEAALLAFGEAVALAAADAGREEERRTHPSLRAFGECVARASAATAARDRAVAREVFERLVETGNNPSFAFYQALDAIGGSPNGR